MELLQEILVYLTLAIAAGYLIRKYLIPKRVFNSGKPGKACDNDECGCA